MPVRRVTRWYGDTPSPPQALPAAFEAEKRSDGRSLPGSCLGDTLQRERRAVPYLFARDPSTKVVVSVSRDGSHYRAIGKGATLETKRVPAHAPRASALTGTLEPPLAWEGGSRPQTSGPAQSREVVLPLG